MGAQMMPAGNVHWYLKVRNPIIVEGLVQLTMGDPSYV